MAKASVGFVTLLLVDIVAYAAAHPHDGFKDYHSPVYGAQNNRSVVFRPKDLNLEDYQGTKGGLSRRTASGTRWKRMDNYADDYEGPVSPACAEKLQAANMLSNVRGAPRGETTCPSTSAGSQCRTECLPGYREEPNPIATCRETDYEWDVAPRCDLLTCSSDRYVFLALDTPARPELQQMSGDHVTIYAVLFDSSRKLPVWSAALVQSEHCSGQTGYNYARDWERYQGYPKHPCTNLKGKQGDYNRDYKGTGYDEGHLTPANIARWSPKATMSINLQINLAPQDHFTNIGPWKMLEAKVACFSANAGNQRSVVVATGICANSIGKVGTLDVPECFWKMVCYQDEFFTEQVVGFISDNTLVTTDTEKDARRMQIQSPVSQSEVLKLLPPGVMSPWETLRDGLMSGRLNKYIPLSPYGCMGAADLPDIERQRWSMLLRSSEERSRARREASSPDKVYDYMCTDDDLAEFLDTDETADGPNKGETVGKCGTRTVGFEAALDGVYVGDIDGDQGNFEQENDDGNHQSGIEQDEVANDSDNGQSESEKEDHADVAEGDEEENEAGVAELNIEEDVEQGEEQGDLIEYEQETHTELLHEDNMSDESSSTLFA